MISSGNLGINLGFANNRFPEPEAWTKIVHDIGLRNVQFVADILNPMLKRYDYNYFDKQVRKTTECLLKNDVRVTSIMTSSFTRVNHFAHPDREYRQIWFKWFEDFLEMGSRFDAKYAGSHFGILTVNSVHSLEKDLLYKEALKCWSMLSYVAKIYGYEYLFFEPMSIEREFGNTIESTHQILDDLNKVSEIPVKLCLDVGHAPHPSQRDYKKWLKAFAKDSVIIHLQQTTKDNSNHSPFTEQFNENGIVNADDVLDILDEENVSPELDFEISFREKEEIEPTVITDLKKSVEYWKKKIEDHNNAKSHLD